MILTNDLSIIELAQATGELVLFIYLFIYSFIYLFIYLKLTCIELYNKSQLTSTIKTRLDISTCYINIEL